MSSSKRTPQNTPYSQELRQLREIFIKILRSRPEDQTLFAARSHVAFYHGNQNKRSKLAIEALPKVTSLPEDETCRICLEKFDGGKQVKEMGCKNLFHKECIIDKVLGAKVVATCPVCGEKVPVRGDKLLVEDMN